MPSTTTKLSLLALTAAAAVAAGSSAALAAASQSESAKPKAAGVQGSAQIRLTYSPDDDIRTFTFDAQAVPYSRPVPDAGAPHGLPTDARGTVRVSHWLAKENVTVRFEAAVDCLATSPGNAALTAVVTRADEPVKDWVGKRLGFSVHDAGKGGGDRVGFSWSVVNGEQNDKGEWQEAKVGTCMAPAAYAPVTKGDYTVRHADLLPSPGK
jgi:hypothetical protein